MKDLDIEGHYTSGIGPILDMYLPAKGVIEHT
jgi:hypothetical protein